MVVIGGFSDDSGCSKAAGGLVVENSKIKALSTVSSFEVPTDKWIQNMTQINHARAKASACCLSR